MSEAEVKLENKQLTDLRGITWEADGDSFVCVSGPGGYGERIAALPKLTHRRIAQEYHVKSKWGCRRQFIQSALSGTQPVSWAVILHIHKCVTAGEAKQAAEQ